MFVFHFRTFISRKCQLYSICFLRKIQVWGQTYDQIMLVGYVGSWCSEVFFALRLIFFLENMSLTLPFPLLTGTYYCVNMVLITMSSFLCVFVVNMSVTGTRYPVHLPKTLKKVCIEKY